MSNRKKRKTYSDLERLRIAIDMADKIQAGNTISSACKEKGISRMALWFWGKKDSKINEIIKQAVSNNKKRIWNEKREKYISENPRASRPEGWKKLKKCPVTLEMAATTNFILTCIRCGHIWRAKSFPVWKCSHPSCQSRYFNIEGRYSDIEKKIARSRRLAHAGIKKNKHGRRGRPKKSLSND